MADQIMSVDCTSVHSHEDQDSNNQGLQLHPKHGDRCSSTNGLGRKRRGYHIDPLDIVDVKST